LRLMKASSSSANPKSPLPLHMVAASSAEFRIYIFVIRPLHIANRPGGRRLQFYFVSHLGASRMAEDDSEKAYGDRVNETVSPPGQTPCAGRLCDWTRRGKTVYERRVNIRYVMLMFDIRVSVGGRIFVQNRVRHFFLRKFVKRVRFCLWFRSLTRKTSTLFLNGVRNFNEKTTERLRTFRKNRLTRPGGRRPLGYDHSVSGG